MRLEDFKDIDLLGDIKEENGKFEYFYQTDFYDPDDDNSTQDHLWDVYVEDITTIRKIYPNLIITDSWADNDSAGCTIVSI